MVEKTGGRAAKVFVRQLRLTNYRNYRSFSADFSDGLVVFTGHNGAGKTNLLEALSFLSPGRGLRRAAYDNVIRSNPVLGSAYGNAVNQREDESLETFEKSGKQETVDSETTIAGLNSPINEAEDSGFVVFAQLHSALYGDASIGTASDIASTGRRIRINGESVASDRLTDYCRISWLVPSMDGLFTGPAADRRRFLDRMVLAIDPAHARRVSDFEKAMRARNRLLTDGSRDEGWFNALEVQMAELAIAIAAARMDVVRLISDIENFDSEETFPSPVLDIEGTIEKALARKSAVDVEEEYRQSLHDKRESDRVAGRTLEGPHRSDMLVYYARKNMPAGLCSTGEQKALLTGLVLSHAQLTSAISGMTPILLLDEMAAHLDPGRRKVLFDSLERLGGQTFMTGTDQQLFADLKDRAQFFELSNGSVVNN